MEFIFQTTMERQGRSKALNYGNKTVNLQVKSKHKEKKTTKTISGPWSFVSGYFKVNMEGFPDVHATLVEGSWRFF